MINVLQQTHVALLLKKSYFKTLRRHFAHPGVTGVGSLWEISSQVFSYTPTAVHGVYIIS